MDKIHALSGAQHHSEKFQFEGENWAIDTQWGDVVLRKVDKNEYFFMDVEASSVFSLSLVVLALKGNNSETSGIKYKFQIKEKRVIFEINTPLEQYCYLFDKRQVEDISLLTDAIEKLKKKCATIKERIPIVGKLKPDKWKEYGIADLISLFPYGNLNLKNPPMIFMTLVGRAGYVATQEVTNKSCKVFIHWNHLLTMPPNKEDRHLADTTWHIIFFLFQQETSGQVIEEEKGKEEKGSEEKKFSLLDHFTPPDTLIKTEPKPFTFEDYKEAARKGMPIILIEDKVIDLKNFFEKHPATKMPWEGLYGKEVGRYFYGNYAYEGFKHPHSFRAFELLSKYQIGIIPITYSYKTFIGLPKDKNLRNYIWKLEGNDGVTDIHIALKFSNPDLKVRPLVDDIHAFGRYFAVKSLTKKETRNYSLVFCCDDEIQKAHLFAVNAFKNKDEKYHPKYPDIAGIELKRLVILVRTKTGFSKWLGDECAKNTEFIFRGPFVFLYLKSFY